MQCLIAFVLLFFTACEAFNFQGATKPLGFFDPLGFSKDVSNSDLLRLRESELKHGRVGMVSAFIIFYNICPFGRQQTNL